MNNKNIIWNMKLHILFAKLSIIMESFQQILMEPNFKVNN